MRKKETKGREREYKRRGIGVKKRGNILIWFPCLIQDLMTAKKQRRISKKTRGERLLWVTIIYTPAFLR